MFDTWMLEESDSVQGLAHAYGERVVNEQFVKAIDSAVPENRAVLEQLRSVRTTSRQLVRVKSDFCTIRYDGVVFS